MNIRVSIEVEGAYSETLVNAAVTRRVIGVPQEVARLTADDVGRVSLKLWEAVGAAKDEVAIQVNEAINMKRRAEPRQELPEEVPSL